MGGRGAPAKEKKKKKNYTVYNFCFFPCWGPIPAMSKFPRKSRLCSLHTHGGWIHRAVRVAALTTPAELGGNPARKPQDSIWILLFALKYQDHTHTHTHTHTARWFSGQTRHTRPDLPTACNLKTGSRPQRGVFGHLCSVDTKSDEKRKLK